MEGETSHTNAAIRMCPEWHFEVDDVVRAESARYRCTGNGVVLDRQFRSNPESGASAYAYSVYGEFVDAESGEFVFQVAWFMPGELTRIKLEPYDGDMSAS